MKSIQRAAHASLFSILAACLYSAVPSALYAQDQETRPAPDRNTQPAPTESDPATRADPSESKSPAAPGEHGSATSAKISDAQVEKFADAYVAVQEIQAKAADKLQSATDDKQALQVKQTAETEMIKAVEKAGLQVDEFNQIVEQMASDTALRSKVNAEIQERI
jgi:hypothetical protein